MNKNVILGVLVAVAILVVGWSIYASKSNNVKPVPQQMATSPHSQGSADETANMIAMIVQSPAGNGLNLAECTSDTAGQVKDLIKQMLSGGMPAKAVLVHLERFGYLVFKADTTMANPHQ